MHKPLILVVDDETAFTDTVVQTIKETDRYDAQAAYSAPEALEILEKNKVLLGLGGNRVRLIILDIKMPGMSGLEFLTKVRESYGPELGVVMLTAWEDEDKWDKATSGFVINYLHKPLKKEELLTTIDRYFSGEDAEMTLETFEKYIDKRKEFKR